MTRGQLVDGARQVLTTHLGGHVLTVEQRGGDVSVNLAEAIVEAILPEITIEEELRALPVGQWLIGHRGEFGPVLVRRSDDFDGTGVMVSARPYTATDALHFFGPLVVWHDHP